MNPFSPSKRSQRRSLLLTATLAYAAVGAAWIPLSDRLAARLFAGEVARAHAHDLFSWLFVAGSAGLLFLLMGGAVLPLQRSQRALRKTIESLPDAVLVLDPGRRILEANRAALELLGVREAGELRVPLEAFCRRFELRRPGGEPVAAGDSAGARALAGETVRREESLLRGADGRELFVSVSAAPVREGPGRPATMAVLSLRDLGELKRLERLRDEFLSIAAHELKTPLASVKGFAQLLRRGGVEGAGADRALEVINRQCDRMNRLVEDLLELSRLDLGRLGLRTRRCELGELAAAAIAHVQPFASRHLLQLDLLAADTLVEADRERVEQVLVNLLDNAVKFSPAGGVIQVSVLRCEGELVVRVEDPGVGIPVAERARIFERFHQAHPELLSSRGGMGIGLTLSREIVERHGGRIWVDTEEGRGSVFSFSLPGGAPLGHEAAASSLS